MATEEIREHLEKGVMNTTPGSKENEIAVKSLNDFNRTTADIDRGEKELKLKQDAADNDLIDKRDENEFRAAQEKRKTILDWVDTVLKAVALVVNSILAAVIIHNDTTGKPLLSGPGRQLVGNTFRRK